MGSPSRFARLIASIALSAPALIVSAALATENPADSTDAPRYRVEPVIVTPGRFPLPLGRVAADVTVLDRAGLAGDHSPLLADAFRAVPGLDVQRSGQLGTLTSVRLRGADPRHTLVLFDGVPLSGPWLGGFDFADLSGAGFDRVEIVGGPASSLYGSGAVGGVIQILSDAGASTAPRLRAFTEYGGGAAFRQGAEWRAQRPGVAAGGAVTRLVSGSADERTGYCGTTAQLYADLTVRGRDHLRVSAVGSSGRKDLPYDFVYDFSDFRTHQVLDPNYEERDGVAAGRASYTLAVAPRASMEAELSGFAGRIENRNEPSGGSGDYQRTSLDNARGTAALRARVAAGGRTQAVLGAEYRSERVDRDDDSRYGGLGSPTRVREGIHSRSLYAQGHAEAAGRLFADGGIRLEDHARHGAYGVPRVALALALPEGGLRIRGGYGRAFTAPTLSDLFYPGYGSPSLRPERSRTWEAGLDGSWIGGRLQARATWHSTRFQDLIQSNSLYVAENIGRARIEGEEISVAAKPHHRIGLTAWAAHLSTKNLDAGGPLPKRPSWRTGARADVVPARDASLSVSWRWVDPVLDPFEFVDAAGRFLAGPVAGHAVLDLAATLPLGHGIPGDLHLRLANALDREYQEVKGYPAAGRTLTAGLSVRP
jgi:vitamin B12 transporter